MADSYAPVLEADVRLADGRALGYAVWGDPEGQPVLLFHGSPSSRLFAPDPAVTAAYGGRLVTVDRPGYGRSDPAAGRRILDWPADVAQLVDALEVTRFAAVAHSSGGPYALACALAMPQRITSVALVSCVAPRDELPAELSDPGDDEQQLVRLARADPAGAAAAVAGAAAWLLTDPDRFLSIPRPPPDELLLQDPPVRSMFAASVREAVRPGLAGYASDEVLERQPWGYRLADVTLPVHLWHGGQDPYIPPEHAEAMAALIPDSVLTLDPALAHGLILTRWEEILHQLLAQ